jgi:Na+/H+-dicarboxylate symporter
MRTFLLYSVAIVLGLVAGFYSWGPVVVFSTVVSDIFMNLLRLVSLPIIFLAITNVATSVEHPETIKKIGIRVIGYTLLTTLLAATSALIIFLVVNPVQNGASFVGPGVQASQESYWKYLLQAVPSNVLRPFLENNVTGVLFFAMLVAFSSFALSANQRQTLHNLFSSLLALFMTITKWIVRFIPLALFAFVALFVKDIRGGLEMKSIGLYLSCVVIANIVQALVILPIFLKCRGISVLGLARSMSPALVMAFFTKSSAATLPTAMRVAEERAGMKKQVAGFVFPLCTTINMNGCAAFILTTTLFVSMSYGMHYSAAELIMWIFVATFTALGNAGVPMGCYFLASAFLAAMNVPLNIMGIILPFYTLIDALETTINVWSDSCVAMAVNEDLREKTPVIAPSLQPVC